MKIEKISDNQIKFVLNKSDLTDRNIKVSELAYGSEKTQELFHEMMEQAFLECDFQSENTPLMIEAIPVTLDSIMILVTKVSNHKEIDNKFNIFSNLKLENNTKNNDSSHKSTKTSTKNNIWIYSFNSIEETIALSLRLNNLFTGTSAMYKDNNLYYLILEDPSLENSNLRHILSEHGKKHVSNLKSKYYLIEHGELILKDNAIQKLSTI